jgi:hypothetical protein
VIGGAYYRFRYRAKNFNGWGPYSELSYILTATVPSRPNAPDLLASDSTSVTLGFITPSDDGGSLVTSYQLFYDEVGSQANFQLVADTTSLSAQVTTTDGLEQGKDYRFIVKAVN